MAPCFPVVQAPKELSYFTAIASIILCLVISSGNFLIILAVIIDPLKKLRSPFSFFLVNLAVSDLVVGIITMPASYAAHMSETKGRIPDHLIKIFQISYFASATASVLSLGALCLDRFVAIKWPIRYRKSLSLKRCAVISLLIWLFAGALTFVYLVAGFITQLMIFAHVAVVFTFTILVLTYHQVYKTLRQRQAELRRLQNSSSRDQNDEIRKTTTEKKVTRAFLFILGLFICSFLPALIMIYIIQFCNNCGCTFRHVLRDLQIVLVCANSAMNPFVCTIRLGPFRRSILAIVTCKAFGRGRNAAATTGSSREMIGVDNLGASGSSGESSTKF